MSWITPPAKRPAKARQGGRRADRRTALHTSARAGCTGLLLRIHPDRTDRIPGPGLDSGRGGRFWPVEEVEFEHTGYDLRLRRVEDPDREPDAAPGVHGPDNDPTSAATAGDAGPAGRAVRQGRTHGPALPYSSRR